MNPRIFDRDGLIEHRFKNVQATHSVIFQGSKEENLAAKDPRIIKETIVQMGSTKWEGSEGYHKTWHDIRELQMKLKKENPTMAAQAPSTTTLADLVEKIFVDVTRRAQEAADLTGMLATESTNFEYPEDINLREILKYRGAFQQITGSNDSVPLIEQNLANVDTVPVGLYAIGWKDSLRNMLFNPLHTIEKVNQAVVDADTDLRNAATVGMIVGATYVATQKQAADSTSGATFDELMYNTLRKGLKVLKGLKDIQTARPIATPSITLLCNSANLWDIERVVRGQLDINGAAGARGNNRQALPIRDILVYDRGINDGFTWGKKTMSFPGVTAGKCYLLVPYEYLFAMNKRPLVMETGAGSVLQLSTQERAWYRAFATYNKAFLGSSYPATSVGAGYGAIVEVTLPADS